MADSKELRLEAYTDAELQAALQELFSFPQFVAGMQKILPANLYNDILSNKDQVKGILDFQKKIIQPFLHFIQSISIDELSSSGLEQLHADEQYLFISNHRDIVLDSAFLNVVLVEKAFNTCQIAIGDNLMKHRLSELLFRINKSFVVKRTGNPRELYTYSIRLSNYIHNLINDQIDSCWIAQREGRAKDGNDQTQIGVLKMISLAKKEDLKTHFKSLKIVPVSISYELNPCDGLKTQEYLDRKNNPDYKKEFQDDVNSIYKGLQGQKGHVHIAFGKPLDEELDALDELKGDKQKLAALANMIDKSIHKSYKLHPINYVALDLLEGKQEYANHYSEEELKKYNFYFEGQIKLFAQDQQADARQYMLGIYANPLLNSLKN